MQLSASLTHVLEQLSALLAKATPEIYGSPVPALSGATMGQHVRHIIELFQSLFQAYESGIVDYEARPRNRQLETDPEMAAQWLASAIGSFPVQNRELILIASDYKDSNGALNISTNYFRELAYNIEHAIHHMALLRVCVWHHGHITLPESFGVAYSTIKHREQCAQ